MPDKKVVGERLKKLRLDKLETQEEVASAVDVTAMAISQYESGIRTPSDEVKVKLSRHFNRSVGLIFFTEE